VVNVAYNKLVAVPDCFTRLADRGVELVYHENPCSLTAQPGGKRKKKKNF
jgi:hypothetical protein